MPEGLARLLWILTPIVSTLSVVLFTVAIVTNDWLYSEEKIPIRAVYPHYNGTEDDEYLLKFTVSGLWTLCYTDPGKTKMNCYNIEYFPKEEYSPDPHDSTAAIPYAVTRAASFYFLSSLMLFVGDFFCFFGFCFQRRIVYIFISGCTFITTGLIILAGLVIYIATFKSEVGIKLEEQSTFQPPLFSYRYGFSFLLVVSCFMASEMAGTAAIFLYLHLHKKMKKAVNEVSAFGIGGCDKHGFGFGAPPPPPLPPCRRHRRRRGSCSRFRDFYASRENSPRPSMVRALGMNVTLMNNTSATLPPPPPPPPPLSLPLDAVDDVTIMRDASYYGFLNRDDTCNTISTTTVVDINRDYSREFSSYDSLRRTTPV